MSKRTSGAVAANGVTSNDSASDNLPGTRSLPFLLDLFTFFPVALANKLLALGI